MRSCYHQGCDSGSNPSLRNSEGIKFLAKTAQAVTLAVAELAGGIEACDLSAFYSEPHSTDELLPEQPRAKLPEAAEDIKNFPDETTETVPAKEIIEEDLSENLPTTNEGLEEMIQNVNIDKSSINSLPQKPNLGPESLLRFLLSNILAKNPWNGQETKNLKNPIDLDSDFDYDYEDQVQSCYCASICSCNLKARKDQTSKALKVGLSYRPNE